MFMLLSENNQAEFSLTKTLIIKQKNIDFGI